ncbi:MAG: galactokinase [Pseudomonadota bacterium]
MEISALFQSQFGHAPEYIHFSPGRVNLIGEHTDYNGGAVLPAVLPLGVQIAMSRRNDDRVQVLSDGFDDRADRTIDETASGHWSDYVVGAVAEARAQGWLDGGVTVAVQSTLPVGSGLSSSSAVIVGLLKSFRHLAGANLPDSDLAMLARKVETDFIGVPCGIMDQMVIATAPTDHALYLDTLTLDQQILRLPEDPVFAVLHSGVHRRLSEGRYKERKEECDQAKQILGREDLCRATLCDLDQMTDPVVRRRTHHCVSEHSRTVAAAKALQTSDFETFGTLMIESHVSMRDDFEITTPEIDDLVADSVTQEALGARMTGGGFGGCIVALVAKPQVTNWRDRILSRHPKARWVCALD